MTVLVDSDVLIDVARGHNQELVSRWRELGRSASVLCSPVSMAELRPGALPHEHKVLNELFDAITCVPIDAEIGRQAGAFLRRYRRSHGIEIPYALIAAGAVANRAVLRTRNYQHYPMEEVRFFPPQRRTH